MMHKCFEKIILASLLCILCLVAYIGIKCYLDREIVKIDYYRLNGVIIIDFYFKNLSRPYTITSAIESWDVDIHNECFVVEPKTELKGIIVINKALEDRILIHVSNMTSGTGTALPYFYSAPKITFTGESFFSTDTIKQIKDKQDVYTLSWTDSDDKNPDTFWIRLIKKEIKGEK